MFGLFAAMDVQSPVLSFLEQSGSLISTAAPECAYCRAIITLKACSGSSLMVSPLTSTVAL